MKRVEENGREGVENKKKKREKRGERERERGRESNSHGRGMSRRNMAKRKAAYIAGLEEFFSYVAEYTIKDIM